MKYEFKLVTALFGHKLASYFWQVTITQKGFDNPYINQNITESSVTFDVNDFINKFEEFKANYKY